VIDEEEPTEDERTGSASTAAFLPGPISLPENLRDTRLFISGMIYGTAMVAKFLYLSWLTRWVGRRVVKEGTLPLYACLRTAEAGLTFAEIFTEVDFIVTEDRRS
jgi:hypothetical protein